LDEAPVSHARSFLSPQFSRQETLSAREFDEIVWGLRMVISRYETLGDPHRTGYLAGTDHKLHDVVGHGA
jgi:hypothetical protein